MFRLIRIALLLIVVVLAFTLLTNRAHGLASDGKTHMPEITNPLPVPPPPLTPEQVERSTKFQAELDMVQYIHEEFTIFAASVQWDFYNDPKLAGVNDRNVHAMIYMLKSKYNWDAREYVVDILIDEKDTPYIIIDIALDSRVNSEMFEYHLEFEMIPGAPIIDEEGNETPI